MSRFQKLKDFERRFETMSVDELKQWKIYWTQHAQGLAPKVRKLVTVILAVAAALASKAAAKR
jgi:hypothetical protein